MESSISKRIQEKMDKLARRLAELESDASVEKSLQEVNAQLQKVEAQLEALQDDKEHISSSARTRLELERDRLFLHKERLEIKEEIMQDRRERLQEALDMQKEAFEGMNTRIKQQIDPLPQHQPHTNPTNMQDERKRILEMLEQGKITSTDAMKLIDALQQQEDTARTKKRRPRWVRIKVTDLHSNRVRVNLTLPVGLVRAGLRTGGKIAGMEGLNTADLEEMLNRGETGHILDVKDEDDGGRVEIYVE